MKFELLPDSQMPIFVDVYLITQDKVYLASISRIRKKQLLSEHGWW